MQTRSVDDDMISILLSVPGSIGSQHARLVRAHRRCRLAAETIDCAVVSSPDEFHFARAIARIDRRIPTLVETSIADRVDEARLS